jgi:hypothetical protein
VAASLHATSGPALAIYSAAGALPRRYFEASQDTARAVAWSPDSRYVAVILSSTDPGSSVASSLIVIDTRHYTNRVLAQGVVYGASFAPDGSDRLVYAFATSTAIGARVNLIVTAPDGLRARPVTIDGRSLNPVWGRKGIAFDHEQVRVNAAPAYQLGLIQPDGTGARTLTRLAIPALQNGLVPVAFSHDGARLLAEYEGQDTSEAWTLTIADGVLHQLMIGGSSVTGGSITADGARVLVDSGGFLYPPDHGVVESVPFGGGTGQLLVADGSEPSWNR